MTEKEIVLPDAIIDSVIVLFMNDENRVKYLKLNKTIFGYKFARQQKKAFILRLLTKKRGKKWTRKLKVLYGMVKDLKEPFEIIGQIGEILKPILSILPIEARLVVSAVLVIPLIIPLFLAGGMIMYILEMIKLQGRSLPPVMHNFVRTWKMLYSIQTSGFMKLYQKSIENFIASLTTFITTLFNPNMTLEEWAQDVSDRMKEMYDEEYIDITTRGRG